MKPGMVIVLMAFSVLVQGAPAIQPPDAFVLNQNDPNPFCPASVGGNTDIRMTVAQQSRIVLQVWGSDTTAVVRTLVNGVLPAGYHSVLWDGRDDNGSILVDGGYPYAMTATDPESGEQIYFGMLVATVECGTAARPTTWGRIKAKLGPAVPK